ncbi:MAG: glycosyltransferase [Aquabacterium sp.]|uniref:glycosyltransferase n=1 Tax=Aquabacterium sp. TaxID=1872578 RepID=UPI003BBAC439
MTASHGRFKTALVMIARNEARLISAVLHSMKPWVDEMIVLDTGSTDDTVVLAKTAGARVAHFTWVNDFSAARNAALDLSDADWNIIVDADEVLQHGGEQLLDLRERQPDFVGRVEVCSGYGATGTSGSSQEASSWLPRVLPHSVRFEGRIHEQPSSTLPKRNLPIRFDHDGYLPEQMRTKGDRNRQLLELAVQQAPHNAYLHYQLGKDHEVHDRFEPALTAYDQALSLLPPETSREPSWRHDLVLRRLFTLKALGHLSEAVQYAETEMPTWPDSPDFYFVLGDVLLDFVVANPEQAGHLVPMIRQAWERCVAIGENPSLEGAVHGRGSVLARQNLNLLDQLLGS